jgi:hypothetical protein
MVRHSTTTASRCSVLLAALMFLLSLAGVAAAQDNTTGVANTAIRFEALLSNTTGDFNTARQRAP